MEKKIIKLICIIGAIFIISANFVSADICFTASNDELVLVGSNEGHNHNNIKWIEVHPPKEGKYGHILFGHNWHAQGMNDQGLYWDGFEAPYLEVTKGEGLTPIPDNLYFFNHVIIENCSTIFDVIELLDSHDISDLPIQQCQVIFIDRFGNSVIFEGDDYVFKEGDYQAVTEFYQTHPELGGFGTTYLERYETAINMLENMDDFSMDYFRDICDATHQNGEGTYLNIRTLYSIVCDLTNLNVNYYYESNYNEKWTFNLSELFEYGEHIYDVSKVFNNNNPNKPSRPNGIRRGRSGEEYTFYASTHDWDGDQIYYKWDFGDGNVSEWLGPYNSGVNCEVKHTWSSDGEYSVKVMARDTNCGTSDWSNPLIVSMPKNKDCNYPLFIWFLSRLASFFPLVEWI